MTAWLADWSHWQGMPAPATRIQAEGFASVKLKAGGSIVEGWTFIDPTFVDSARAVDQTSLIPAAFWYLMPSRPRAQAGLFLDLLESVGWLGRSALILDVEQEGLTRAHVQSFVDIAKPRTVYTRQSIWDSIGVTVPVLELSHWVPESVRFNPATPYASQQARYIDPSWWGAASILQFTDHAMVGGKWTSASTYKGSKDQLRALIV